jgi:hypothetical protein
MASEALKLSLLSSQMAYSPGDTLNESLIIQDSFGLGVRREGGRITNLVVVDVCRVDETLQATECYEPLYHRFGMDGVADFSLSNARLRWPAMHVVCLCIYVYSGFFFKYCVLCHALSYSMLACNPML